MNEYREFIIKVSHADLIAGSPFGTPYFHGEIVRCRDCKFKDEDELGNLCCHGPFIEPWDYYNDEPSDGVKVEPDGFCAWASRKEVMRDE